MTGLQVIALVLVVFAAITVVACLQGARWETYQDGARNAIRETETQTWGDGTPAAQAPAARQLPAWVDDPQSYGPEFEDIADRMPDVEARLSLIAAKAEEEELT